MELKNAKIGILIEDWQLRLMLSNLLMQNGAIVYGVQNEAELI